MYKFHWNRIAKKLCMGVAGVATWQYVIWVILMRMKYFKFLFLKWQFSYLRRYNGFSVLPLKFKSTLQSWNRAYFFDWDKTFLQPLFPELLWWWWLFTAIKFFKNMILVWDETWMLKKASLEPLGSWVSISFAPWAGSTWRGLRTCSFWAVSAFMVKTS